ncbi:hypothetical protein EG68_04944 [Paragonimus skrjabini miyazakii]|uniref:Uncharacterized protein n=1 Tax=Paragonimus skrjabini miyazakii TaxID=59628 RepID=A0A8S9YZV6_9TREM|nr:hypothetical protein EG68_04944 [Paragonimus skrjabini miyazakii]
MSRISVSSCGMFIRFFIWRAPPKRKPPNLTRAELLMRMQVYQKKLEVLELKKIYWTNKLQRLSSQCETNPFR